jgi:ribosomal-protein-alanine N-acetyltransferase
VLPDAGVPTGFPAFLAPVLELEAAATGYWAVIAVSVYPEHRGQGLAKQLLNHALELAAAEGAVGLSLVVEDTNLPALALYRGMGFGEWQSRPWLPYGSRSGPRRWLLLTRVLGSS